MGNRYAKTLQYGKESTHGTHVAATTILLADAPIPDDIVGHNLNYNLGVRVRANEAAVLYKAIESLPIKFEDTYFQALHFPLALTLKGGVSGVEQTTGQHDYLSTYTPGLTAATADTMESATLEICDDQHQTEIGYVMGKSVKFTWTFGQDGRLTTEMDCFGDFVDNTITKTPGLTIPDRTLVNPNLLKFYADALWANAGTTQLTGVLRQINLEIIGGAHPKPPHGNGTIIDSHGVTYVSWKLGLVLEDNAAAADFYTWYRAQTAVAICLKQDGPQIGTGGVNNLTIKLWGKPDVATLIGQEENGDQLMPVTMSELYDTTGSATLAVTLTSDKQAL